MRDFLLNWVKCAGIRAIKTFAQTMASMITVGAVMSEIDWLYLLSCSLVAFIYSVLTSIAGLPEVRESEGADDNY